MTPRRLIEPARLAGTSMLRTQSDARLVDLARAGHSAAFEAIVQRYRKPLLKYCGKLLPSSRAEDAVQQTFLKAYQSMVSGDAELNLRPWLYRIAHNSSLNLLRQNGWSHDELNVNMDGVQRPDQALELKERLRATVVAVNELPERQRNAVLLREVEGLSYEEIALALGVGDGAVRQLLHRARATLRAGASAVTPAGVLERLATAMASGADPSVRVTELAGGIGAGTGALKLGAALLATGALATGAITGPLSHESSHKPSQRAADEALAGAASSSRASDDSAGSTVQPDDRGRRGSRAGRGGGSPRGRHHGSGSNSGSRHRSSHEGGGSGERSGEHRSGSGGGDDGLRSGSGGGSDDPLLTSTGGSGSGSSGGSGSDDGTTQLFSSDGGSGTSGGGTTSGDGSNDGTTVTSPTSDSGSLTVNSGSDGGSSSGSSGDLQPSGG